MKNYKKRTLALILGTVVSIAGTFATENYKNTLTGINFETSTTGTINVVLQTRNNFTGSVSPIRRDANTYIIMLPETSSEAPTPNLDPVAGNIQSINVRTMPYSSGAKGYTRITIKTSSPTIGLSATNRVQIASSSTGGMTSSVDLQAARRAIAQKNQSTQKKQRDLIQEQRKMIAMSASKAQNENLESQEVTDASPKVSNIQMVKPENYQEKFPEPETSNSASPIYLLYGILLVLGCVYFYVRAKNKIREIVGNDINFAVKEDPVIKNNLKNKTTSVKPVTAKEYIQPVTKKENKHVEELNIVDLDDLFRQQNSKKMSEEEENAALEDFLSGFSFDDSFEQKEDFSDASIGYDDSLYEKIINCEKILFSKNELKCINQLLGNELQDDLRRNVKKYLVSNPLSISKNKDKLIEELVTTYAVAQNITFKNDDIEILKKLINVELDSSFVKDLRTSAQRTKEMEEEIMFPSKEQKKSSEIKTLKVKEALPNLSEELKSHGNKKIVSEYKPDAVFFSAGYDCKTLSVGADMPNLALEIFKDDLFKYKPSAQYEILDTNYSIGNKEIKINQNLTPSSNLNSTPAPVPTPVPKPTIAPAPVAKPKSLDIPKDGIQEIDKTFQINEKNDLLNERKLKPTSLSSISDNIISKCIIDGESMAIVSSVSLEESNKGCYLAKKENGYLVLGYVGDKLIKLKHYDSLKSEKIQARKSEKLLDGTSRFIIRIGLNKFVVDLKDEQISYVMDLC